MIKTKKIIKQVETLETVDILCNKCGKTCDNAKRYYDNKKNPYYEGIENQEVGFGYMSEFFGDMTSIRFSLCEECLFKLVKTFKIPHEEKNELTSDYVSSLKMKSIIEKAQKQNKIEWIEAVLKIESNKKSKKQLLKMSMKKIMDLFYSLEKSK